MRVYFMQVRKIIWLLCFILLLGVVLVSLNFNNHVIETINDYRVIFEGEKNKKVIALTFNVDWGQENIPAIIEILKKEEVKATFFITGRWAKLYPEYVKKISESGHEIGNHGYSHKHHELLKFEACLKEIQDTEKMIYDICKKRTSLFAPPYGEKGEAVVKSAYAAGYRTVYWTIDTVDWRRPAPEKIIARVKKFGLSNGAIVLMHPTEPTTKALPELISYIKKSGYKLMPVSKIAGVN